MHLMQPLLDRLAQLLVTEQRCDRLTIERGQRVADESGQRLDHVLLQLGLISERSLAECYAGLLQLPLLDTRDYPVREPLLTECLSGRFLREVRALPVRLDGARLQLALVDPLDSFVVASVSIATGLEIRPAVAVPIDLDTALDRLYPKGEAAEEKPEADTQLLEGDAERLKDMASEAPVIRTVNGIIARAVETLASDVHIEPFEDRLRVRYRYDGVLHEAESLPPKLAAAIISRIKIMARLDIAERRLPQDGRIKLAIRGREIDFRVSTIPALFGESVVLRVLDRSAVTFDFAQLGMSAPIVARLRDVLDLPNGIVLVTGPTGSGKTTTLYSSLLTLNAVTRKVITVEDPIEYQLSGINQIQTKPQIGLDFASLLRSILRQDPDVIMVGEIRDVETARIAVQAALTGHLVLSTLHTNSAAAAVSRLRDMGVEDYLLTAVLRAVVGQRLVRRLCEDCRCEEASPEAIVKRLGLERLATQRPVRLWRPVGCPACRGTGFRGRVAIAEFLAPDAEVQRLILAQSDQATIERAAVSAGMTTMFEAGITAALTGVTTVAEVARSIQAEAE